MKHSTPAHPGWDTRGMDTTTPFLNPTGLHTECGPLNAVGQRLHRHPWPMSADHRTQYRPVGTASPFRRLARRVFCWRHLTWMCARHGFIDG